MVKFLFPLWFVFMSFASLQDYAPFGVFVHNNDTMFWMVCILVALWVVR